MSDETTPQQTPTPAPATPPAAPPPAPAPPATVTIPADHFKILMDSQARIAQLESENRQREAAAREEQVRLLTAKGDAENATKLLREQSEQQLKAERDKLVQIEDRAKRYALDGELSRALAGQPLASKAAAAQLAEHFRKEFQVHEEGGSFTVRTPTFQTVDAFIAEKLAHPDYAHFIRANTQGGTAGSTGGHQDRPTGQDQAPEKPKNMGEAIIASMKSRTAAAGSPTTNINLPMGLKRIG